MPTMVCVKCQKFMHCKKVGVAYEEGMPTSDVADGTVLWRPYKLWMADLYKCQDCGVEIIAGQGAGPLSEHYEEDYLWWRERYPPMVVVNDCPGPYIESKRKETIV